MRKKFPKVGERFYWKDINGILSEDVCVKIEGDDNPNIETMYFTYVDDNCNNCLLNMFVPESAIIFDTDEIRRFAIDKRKKEIEEFVKSFKDLHIIPSVYNIICKHTDGDTANNIINSLLNIKEY